MKILLSLEEKRLKFVTEAEFARLFKIENQNTLNKTLQRLNKNGILIRVIKGKYVLASADYGDFELANFLVQPSYVSFESALSFYGVLPQFTYTLTSATIKRTKKIFFSKEYEYTHLNRNLFWGFVKNKNLILFRSFSVKMLFIVFRFVFCFMNCPIFVFGRRINGIQFQLFGFR